LVPQADWEDQIARWQGIGRHLFWRLSFPGFWPPEMGFCMEMIPLLKRLGYRYVLVDSDYVEPLEPMRWEQVRYRPHLARHQGQEMIVVVRDRDLSNAQQAGADAGWFMYEVHERTKWCDFPPLVTTCSDGDNGGWFRNSSPLGNFWGVLYQPLLDRVRRGETEVQPTFIEEYLDRFGAEGLVRVNEGAWNTGWHNGHGFTQWSGGQEQKDALTRLGAASAAFHAARGQAQRQAPSVPELDQALEQARWRMLRAQTSCNFFWGSAWVGRCHRDLDEAEQWLQRAAGLLAAR
jgi:alpha-amylase/alpha-mannosidase (GH57 family)